MAFLLGCDIGSSSVKVAIVRTGDGSLVSSAFAPKCEAPISAPSPGFAEQDPEFWYACFKEAFKEALAKGNVSASDIEAIGISYQMHGLVLLDEAGQVLRPSIIWCDSRAVDCGAKIEKSLGRDWCQERLLNSPGNFTAAKLRWVAENQPDILSRTRCMMLPGDYLAYRLSGQFTTTSSGLSEGTLWDFKMERPALEVLQSFGVPAEIIPAVKDNIGYQCAVNASAAQELGLAIGTPISYRAGDQPNNAFSLKVLENGEVAATAGTSGVIYAVSAAAKGDQKGRFNLFAHVNHKAESPHLGALMCLNGAGSLLSFTRHNFCPELSYDDMNRLAETAGEGSSGLVVLPFGNGAERVLCNRVAGGHFAMLDTNRHSRAHIIRAVQEGVACAFRYGMDAMIECGHKPKRIRAGLANMFLSPLFVRTLCNLSSCPVELYETDGARGAALGAGLGAGFYKDEGEALQSLALARTCEPESGNKSEIFYRNWQEELDLRLNKQ